MTQTVTLALPGPLYTQLRERADRSHRSLEEEALDVLTAAVPTSDDLSPDLTAAVTSLAALDDEALWRAARVTFGDSSRVSELHDLRSARGLTVAERDELEGLIRRYERAMLVRAQASALLSQRGHDVSILLRQT